MKLRTESTLMIITARKKSGVLGGGIGVTFGSQKQTTESDQTKLYAQGSQVGSLNGNTTMIAEKHLYSNC